MDITPQDSTATQSISDDQELAKALAGVMPDDQTDEPSATPALPGMDFEETTAPAAAPAEAPAPAAVPAMPAPADTTASDATPSDGALTDIKNTALQELRPLIGKVDLPAEEKFDTYLMLLRSTDDPSLIEPAHSAAQGISDEKRKAEALLEIIKEIDYLSRKDQEPKA